MIMARQGIWSGADLQRLLEEKTCIKLSAAAISRLMQEEQHEIKLQVLDALCVALHCMPAELLVAQNCTSSEADLRRNQA